MTLPADGGGTTLPALAAIPDPTAVAAAAALFPPIATAMNGTVTDIATTWKGLGGAGVFETPDTQTVLSGTAAAEQIADLVAVRAAGARKALEDYASTLGTLATRVAALAPDIEAVNAGATGAGAPDPTAVGSSITAINQAAQAADEECARVLRGLAQLTHIPGASDLIAFHEWEEHGGEILIGIGEGTIDRYRRLLVPTPGEPLPTIVEPEAIDVVAKNGGIEFAESKSGLLLPETYLRSQQTLPDIDTSGMSSKGAFTGAPDETPGGIPAWAEGAGRVITVAGVVITVGATGLDTYQEDEEQHPDWSQGHDIADASVAAATTGAGAAAGAWAGAELGAEGGAAIGTLICPGVGTVIGGILGGAIGGFIGGDIGGKIGSGVHHLISDVSSWF